MVETRRAGLEHQEGGEHQEEGVEVGDHRQGEGVGVVVGVDRLQVEGVQVEVGVAHHQEGAELGEVGQNHRVEGAGEVEEVEGAHHPHHQRRHRVGEAWRWQPTRWS